MDLADEKVYLFDMMWTDDGDYEHIFEQRLHDNMIPFFSFKNATFTKELDFESGYKPVATIYAQFLSQADKYKFMLKYCPKFVILRPYVPARAKSHNVSFPIIF